MPAQYHHGVRVIEVNGGIRPIRTIQTSIIGVVCTADDADAATFPLDTPVLIAGTYSSLAKAGTTGTLKATLDAIFDQIAPMIIVVRVAENIDQAVQATNVIGGVDVSGNYTGMQALLNSKAKFGFKPRILGAPGLDNQAVITEFNTLCDKLRAFAYVNATAATPADAVIYRNNFGSKRMMLIWPEFTGLDGSGNVTTLHATARALGLRAKIDNDIGWHKTLSNVPVNGVTGISQDVFFDLQSTASDADLLNSNEVTTLINEKGFRFWGSRTCSANPQFAFESATRTGDVLADTIAEGHAWAVDKPQSKTLIAEIVEGINAKFRELKAQGYIVDGSAWLDPEKNTLTSLESGELHIDYDYTPVPPLENLNFYQHITNTYLSQLVGL